MPRSLARKLIWAIALLYPAILAIGSLSRPPKVLSTPLFSDKIAHAIAYLLLTVVWYFYLDGVRFRESNQIKNLTRAACSSFLYGMLIEVLQWKLTSYRTADYWDLVANGIGVGLAVLLLILTRKKLEQLKLKF